MTSSSYLEALAISLNRYSAAVGAGDLASANLQRNAILAYEDTLVLLLQNEAATTQRLLTSLQQDGLPDFQLTVADVTSLQSVIATNGFPDEMVQILTHFGLTAAEIDAIKQSLLAAPAQSLSGSLFSWLQEEVSLSQSGSLTVSQSSPTMPMAIPVVTVTGGTFGYDGTSHGARASVTGLSGGPVSGSFSINYAPGGSSAPVNAGSYAVTVQFKSNDPNYTDGVGSGTITITPPTTIQTTTPTGSMHFARTSHQSTVLNTGLVLANGGQSGGIAVPQSELFNPSTGKWSVTGGTVIPRFDHTATLLLDGRVLAAGGVSSDGDCTSNVTAETYDPATGKWSLTGRIPSPVGTGHIAVRLSDGRVLVAGGGDRCGAVFNTASIFDPHTNTWTATGNMTIAREFHSAELLADGRVLVAGGVTNSSLRGVSTAEVYDSSSGIWTPVASMGTVRQTSCNGYVQTYLASVSSDTVLAAGGFSGTNCPLVTPARTVAGLSVTPGPVHFSDIGQAQLLTVTALMSDASTPLFTGPLQFSSANTAVVSIDSSGRLTAVGEGTTSITVTAPNVTPVVVTTTVELKHLTSMTANLQSAALIGSGQTVSLAINGQYSNGSQQTLTSGITFLSSNTNIASVDQNGLITSGANGSATITISAPTVPALSVGVIVKSLLSIGLSPTSVNLIGIGQVQTISVFGQYSDGSQQTLSAGLNFISSNPSVARVDLSGVITSVNNGTATITVSAVSVPPVQIPISVKSPASISVTPAAATLAVAGATRALTITLTYSDGSTATISNGLTFVSSENTIATVSSTGIVTSVAAGAATITATYGSLSPAHADITVIALPDLVVTTNHTGNFSQGQSGALYTITVRNVGSGPTVGTVTAVDTLPAGMTATAISGSGWDCVLGTLTCTRSDVLAPGASYPPITLTVNVAVNAAASLNNTATVSGGGEVNASNDTTIDVTGINQLSDLRISKTHSGFFVRGQIGPVYAIAVSNVGTGGSVGPVTVADTLPAGLTATAINGTGWTCVLGTLSCTRSDVLAPGASYPPITLTVNVAANAAGTVTNTATVSGGGDANTSNNISSNPTTIIAPFLGGNLISNGTFDANASGWTLGGGCGGESWVGGVGNPGGAVQLESCGESSSDPTARQTVSGLVPGATYLISVDVRLRVNFSGANGKSFGVFIDNEPGNPIFLGEFLDSAWHTVTASFTATSSTHTIILAGELDARTAGVPSTTDVSYYIDNVSLAAYLATPNSYSTTNGNNPFFDDTYNGSGCTTCDNALLSGGLGQLTDGRIGLDNWSTNIFEWIGWDTLDPTITFDFGSPQLLNVLKIHSNNFQTGGVSLWASVVADFSNDGINFSNSLTFTPTAAQRADKTARYIDVGIPQTQARFARLHFTHASQWIFISEIQFQGDPLTTVAGRVVDSSSTPVAGAVISAGGKSGISVSDGSYSIPGVSTSKGNLMVTATFVRPDGTTLTGRSVPVVPVPAGTTNAGTISLLPIPVISSVTPNFAFPGETVTGLKVVGANLAGSTFAFSPSGSLTISSLAIAADGTSATFTLAAAAGASGSFTLVATNFLGTSDPTASAANRVTVLTNPEADTDGDGFSDGFELIFGSDPANKNSIPLLSSRGDLTSAPVVVLNNVAPYSLLPTSLTAVSLPVSVRNNVIPFASVVTEQTNVSAPVVVRNDVAPYSPLSEQTLVSIPIVVKNLVYPFSAVSEIISSAVLVNNDPLSVSSIAANSINLASNSQANSGNNNQPPSVFELRTTGLDANVTSVVEGQTFVFSVVTGTEVRTVEFLVNGVSYLVDDRPEFEVLLTVPVGLKRFTVVARALAADDHELATGTLDLPVLSAGFRTITGRATDENGYPIAGANVNVVIDGLQAEFFDFQNITSLPDLTNVVHSSTGTLTAVNLRNPQSVLGVDPLGTTFVPDYAARFQGWLRVTQAGVYRLSLAVNAGGRLRIGGQTAIDAPNGTGTYQESEADVDLAVGLVPIELTFYQGTGTTQLQLSWTPPGGEKAVIRPESFAAMPPSLSATSDGNGYFQIENLPGSIGHVQIIAGAQVGGKIYVGSTDRLPLTQAGQESSNIVLKPNQ